MTVFGPYDTERQAAAEPMPRAVYALHRAGLVRSGDPDRLVRNTVHDHLLRACEEAGVQLGDYDSQLLAWLSSYEHTTVQVIIGLISRASSANLSEKATS